MRKPTELESLYLDFDGFFASVMQQALPELRGKPVGVIPFELTNAQTTTVIACSKEAKAHGCSNVMRVPEALAKCPDLILVPQRPDLFRRAHNTLLNEIGCVLPIETVKSIDELACRLDSRAAADPWGVSQALKERLATNVGPYITCSIGFAANRMLAKIACKIDKPNGTTIWHPRDMPGPLENVTLADVPGIGSRMIKRLNRSGILTIPDLMARQPKEVRRLWNNVNGERLWYALHGYALHATPTARGMYGHGRVLPPDWRAPDKAEDCSRLLLTKAARRMRRDGWAAGRLFLWLSLMPGRWSAQAELPAVQDDKACLDALKRLWIAAKEQLPKRARIMRVGVTLLDLSKAAERQLDWLLDDDQKRQRWEAVTQTMDGLNHKFGKRVVTIGKWTPPPGGFAGGKIAFTRIPSAEDFW
ncbi:MAG: type VI secretion protein ImpB [Alphaproteobacteria bacterium]|nr:type VI secretion protein ImpB [Alphaproteobacteria bacterium]